MTRSLVLRHVLVAVAVLLASACADAPPSGGDMGGADPGAPDGSAGRGDGGDGAALGGAAQTTLLAKAEAAALPDGPLAWTAFRTGMVRHRHGPAFVYAPDAPAGVTLDGQQQSLARGEGLFVGGDTPHEHDASGAWEVVLAAPDAEPPKGAGERLFASDALEGLPAGPARMLFILVELPPGTRTSVHTHPGPEYIYVVDGMFTYENGIIGAVTTTRGEGHTLPAGTPVQKRNAEDSPPAAFLSWFVVDPDQPFAPAAELPR